MRFLFGSHDSPKQELYSLKELLPLTLSKTCTPTSYTAPQDSVRFLFGSHDSPKQELYSLKELLPSRFGPLDLLEPGSAPLLLEEQDNQLEWALAAGRALRERAGEAAFQAAAAAALEAARRVRTCQGRWEGICIFRQRSRRSSRGGGARGG